MSKAKLFLLIGLVSGAALGDARVEVDPGDPILESIGRVKIAERGACSAQLVGYRVALTAAHCIISEAREMVFLPSLHSGNLPQGTGEIRVQEVKTFGVEGANTPKLSPVDFAILVLEEHPKSYVSGKLAYHRWLPLKSLSFQNRTLSALGYAGNRSQGTTPVIHRDCQVSRDNFNGVAGLPPGVFSMTCEVSAGQSGGAIVHEQAGTYYLGGINVNGSPQEVAPLVSLLQAMRGKDPQAISFGVSITPYLASIEQYIRRFSAPDGAGPASGNAGASGRERHPTGSGGRAANLEREEIHRTFDRIEHKFDRAIEAAKRRKITPGPEEDELQRVIREIKKERAQERARDGQRSALDVPLSETVGGAPGQLAIHAQEQERAERERADALRRHQEKVAEIESIQSATRAAQAETANLLSRLRK